MVIRRAGAKRGARDIMTGHEFPEPSPHQEIYEQLRHLTHRIADLTDRNKALEDYNAHQLIKTQALQERVEALEKRAQALVMAVSSAGVRA